jgi:fructoselysine-6-P-deglycase FrlB-like protein
MSHFSEEYRTQPACWRQAADVANKVAALPVMDSDVAFIGCGTSYYMGLAAARYREAQLGGISDAYSASDYPLRRRYDHLVVISRSGLTSEVLETVRAAKGVRTIAVTVNSSTPLVELVDEVVTLPFANEVSLVQTRFATSALALWLSWCGWDLDRSADKAAAVMTGNSLPEIDDDVKQLVFLGSGVAEPLAHEAALKFREIFGTWTEAYSISEFRHGPMAAVGPRSLVWLIGTPDERIEEQVGKTGARLFRGGDDPLVELVRVHCAADRWATTRGIDPDELVVRARRFKELPS